MVIDFHTHIFPEELAARAVAKLARAARAYAYTDGTAGGLTASMKAAGVDRSVVLPVATRGAQVEGVNRRAAEKLAETAKTGLIPFGGIHPEAEHWKEALDALAASGVKGVKLHPVYQGLALDDRRWAAIVGRAAELGLIIVVHCGWDIGIPDSENALPDRVLGLLRQVRPDKLVLAHMGGWKCWEEAADKLAGLPVYVDTAFSLGSICPDRPEHMRTAAEAALLDEAAFTRLARAYGTDRVLFATDSPWSGQGESLAFLSRCPLTEGERTAILGGNAAGLLGLEAEG